jgi:plasmid stabilization system protein ParE
LKIRIIPQAETDIEDAFCFFEAREAGLGVYFLDSMQADIDGLAWFAGIHPEVFGCHRMLTKRFPYAVYYRIVGDTAIVLAVLSCRRDPDLIRQRLDNRD